MRLRISGGALAMLKSQVMPGFIYVAPRQGCSSPLQRRGFSARVKEGPASEDAGNSKYGAVPGISAGPGTLINAGWNEIGVVDG